MTRIDRQPFGETEGRSVDRFHLTSESGVIVDVLTYGGVLQAIRAPDRDGVVANVTLAFDSLAGYLQPGSPFFGALVGRFANRIANGRFSLDGIEYSLATNAGPNALHGGLKGFDKLIWTATEIENGVALQVVSPDDDQGYPGELSVTAEYTLSDAGSLRIEYTASTSAPTVINLTNHAYFNLAGEGSGSVESQLLRLSASYYLPTDETAIPTGGLSPVAGTPFDFGELTPIGSRIRDNHEQIALGKGYDHCYVIDRPEGDTSLVEFAEAIDPVSGRRMTVSTTEPGVQLYTANYLDAGLVGEGGRVYRQTDAFCLETQHFPDSPNRPGYPSTVLRPGDLFRSVTTYSFSVDS